MIINKSKDYFWNCLLIIDIEGLISLSYCCLSTAIIFNVKKMCILQKELVCIIIWLAGQTESAL